MGLKSTAIKQFFQHKEDFIMEGMEMIIKLIKSFDDFEYDKYLSNDYNNWILDGEGYNYKRYDTILDAMHYATICGVKVISENGEDNVVIYIDGDFNQTINVNKRRGNYIERANQDIFTLNYLDDVDFDLPVLEAIEHIIFYVKYAIEHPDQLHWYNDYDIIDVIDD